MSPNTPANCVVLSLANDKFIDGVDIKHTDDGFEKLSDLLRKVEQAFEARPVCVMESTGHYHRRLARCISIRPAPSAQSHQSRQSAR